MGNLSWCLEGRARDTRRKVEDGEFLFEFMLLIAAGLHLGDGWKGGLHWMLRSDLC